ncbi:unnamed protein product [Fraxinus pennsylvanica]|uniref:Uncharacterized protein n=1 Tax=Fraxinus pennsylvanica TaxID=56036 RepID=A0AAD2A8M0_9LAMI|nr:unnamed protein product [Fraxinus pennsylvanica]
MEIPEKFGRFSSCRGVAFEIKPHPDPFAISNPTIDPPRNSTKLWLPWGNASKIVSSSELMQRSMSRTSSHFCDLELDYDDDVDTLADIEEGYEEEKVEPLPLPLPPALSKREQPKATGSAAKAKPSRLSVILLDQGLFTVYKRLFVVCLALNITGLALDPGYPHLAELLKLYGPPPPQQSTRAPLENPAQVRYAAMQPIGKFPGAINSTAPPSINISSNLWLR